jgi:hypothetical protein
MKVVIDLIEDIQESIQNEKNYTIAGMLLKENPNKKEDLTYAGEAPVGSFYMDKISKELIFTIEKDGEALTIGELVKHLLILDMDMMMYEVKLAVSEEHEPKPLVGFGFNATDAKYALFIMA